MKRLICALLAAVLFFGAFPMEAAAAENMPAAPNVTLQVTQNGVKLNWDAVAFASCYQVYRKVGTGKWTLLKEVNGDEFLDTEPKGGIANRYYVVTCRRTVNGMLRSEKSQVVKTYFVEPSASNKANGIRIEWNAAVSADSYRVYRKTGDGDWKLLAKNVTALRYADTTARAGKTYRYAVRAYKGEDCLSTHRLSSAIVRLEQPAVKAKTLSSDSIKLSWKEIAGADHYILSVRQGSGPWQIIYSGSNTAFTAKNLNPGETYAFSVRAVNGKTQSLRSLTVDAQATYPKPAYTLEQVPGEGIRISWDAIEGAGSYRVYRRTGKGNWKGLGTIGNTEFMDTEGRAGVTYEYAVRAFEKPGGKGISGLRATGKSIVYSRVDPTKPMVALTFDDGPSKFTKDILDQLEKYGSHATFFVVGNRVETYAKTIKRAYELGNEIGNHSWSHPSLSSISVKSMKNQISTTDDAILKVIGVKPELIRPPYGSVDSDVKKYAGKPLINWSIDTRDWEHRNSGKTVAIALKEVRNGSIILMHDIYAPTRDAAVSLIPALIERGYQLVTVSELAAYRGKDLKDGTVYYSFYP